MTGKCQHRDSHPGGPGGEAHTLSPDTGLVKLGASSTMDQSSPCGCWPWVSGEDGFSLLFPLALAPGLAERKPRQTQHLGLAPAVHVHTLPAQP